ncbi:hypothetical protein IAT38_000975 [Cryptococcus sp. DSM 104549]
MRVFWPSAGISRRSGSVVGWRLEDTLCVAGIVESWMAGRVADIEAADGLPPLEKLGKARSSDEAGGGAGAGQVVFWLPKDRRPNACSIPIDLVLYDPPDPGRLRFLALSPRRLSDKAGHEQMAIEDGYGIAHTHRDRGDSMPRILHLINHVKGVQSRLVFAEKQPLPNTPRRETAPAKSTPIDLKTPGVPHDTCARTSSFLSRLGPLCHASATVDQLCLRLTQALDGPDRFRRTREIAPMEIRSERYISFWNTVWLVANDLILGYCASELIRLNAPLLAQHLGIAFSQYAIDVPVASLRWLNDWPVGLKLNTPLSQFFCTSFGLIIQRWGDALTPKIDYLTPVVLSGLSFASLGGLTLLLALLQDIANLLTLHLNVCYRLMRVLYGWQVESLGGLWNLFRGKRWNILRQRTDSYEYDVDQLFLGTLLFTVSAFLFPTVLTYKAFFGLTRVIMLGVGKTLGVARTALNGFPLFEIMLRLKEPSRLPAGVYMTPLRNGGVVGVAEQGRVGIAQVTVLKNIPKSLSSILQRS